MKHNQDVNLGMIGGVVGYYIFPELSVEVEGKVGQYQLYCDNNSTDALTAQLCFNLVADIIQVNTLNFYTEAGFGIAYLEKTLDRKMIANHSTPAIYQWGLGVCNNDYVIGARFVHMSTYGYNHDTGIDTIGLHLTYLF